MATMERTRRSDPAPPAPEVPERPALADGVRLHGQMASGAYVERQWLAEKDGQFLQLTELVYRVAELADGRRTVEQIAVEVSRRSEWRLESEHVGWLLAARLIPAGLVDGPGAARPGPRAPSPLAVNVNMAMLGPEPIARISGVLEYLYAPPLLVPLLAAVAATQAWLYLDHGAKASLEAVMATPGAFLVLLALVLASTAFHELGHAAALHYGGGRARAIGVGFYLGFPAFYTDVTDSYRLGRWGRVRTDLGGFYFNLLFALAMVLAYWTTRWELLLLVVLVVDLEILHQLLPFVRLDGYWLLADLTGVPDFFSRMADFVRSWFTGAQGAASPMPELKWWAKAVFGLYTVAVVPWLAVSLLFLVSGLPHILATAQDAMRVQLGTALAAGAAGDVLAILAAYVRMVLLALPIVGIAVLLFNLARSAAVAVQRWSGRPQPVPVPVLARKEPAQ
jgi:putative peptide zinc metalloprotease protein